MPLLHPPEPYCLFEDGRTGTLLTAPRGRIIAQDVEGIRGALAELEANVADGAYAAGYLRYEAAAAFHPKLTQQQKVQGPLLSFALFDSQQMLSRCDLDQFWRDKTLAAPTCSQAQWRAAWDAAHYKNAAEEVLEHLRCGDIYQANITFPLTLDVDGSAEALYARLRRNQPAAYSAFLCFDDSLVLSVSPERFFAVENGVIKTQPMKGTAPATAHGGAHSLQTDPKNRAENLMITDLLRNDLSRVAEPASVSVPALFNVERLPSVYQMTSRIEAKRKMGTSLTHLFDALFPCGSVTGAPKLSAMHIIKKLEPQPRGIYCGAIGMLNPSGDMSFNVPIRTLVQDAQGPCLNVGSGIVADSKVDQEYAECLLKAQFLNAERPPFSLLETMAYDGAAASALPQYWQLHKNRLSRAVEAFNFPSLPDDLDTFVSQACLGVAPKKRWAVRLLYSAAGALSLTVRPAPEKVAKWRVRVGTMALPVAPEFLNHKTTYRAGYAEAQHRLLNNSKFDEVFLVSSDGALREGCFTNIFVEKSGQLQTPRDNGTFLPGILREHLIGTNVAIEADLTVDDLNYADAVYAGNALRGLIAVTIVTA